MASIPLKFATRDYQYITPLATGDVTIPGVDLTFVRAFDAQNQIQLDASFDGGEMSFSHYLQGLLAGHDRFIGIPAFVRRSFSHRSYYVRRDSGIRDIADLKGKRVGTDDWRATSAVWARAVLREHGVAMADIEWTIGKLSPRYRLAGFFPTQALSGLPTHVSNVLPDSRWLAQSLIDGELDALIQPIAPPEFHDPDSPIVRLYDVPREAEQAWYAKTGLYPTMHVLVLSRTLAEANPQIVRAIYEAFEQAQRLAEANRIAMNDGGPWSQSDMLESTRLLGPEILGAYGLKANAATLARFYEEQTVQGLVAAPVDPEMVFADFTRLAGAC